MASIALFCVGILIAAVVIVFQQTRPRKAASIPEINYVSLDEAALPEKPSSEKKD